MQLQTLSYKCNKIYHLKQYEREIVTKLKQKLILKGLELRNIRKQLEYTQEEMGKKLFVTRKTIGDYEKSDKIPTDKEKLVRYLLKEETNTDFLKESASPYIVEKSLKDFKIEEIIHHLHTHKEEFKQNTYYQLFCTTIAQEYNNLELAQENKNIRAQINKNNNNSYE